MIHAHNAQNALLDEMRRFITDQINLLSCETQAYRKVMKRRESARATGFKLRLQTFAVRRHEVVLDFRTNNRQLLIAFFEAIVDWPGKMGVCVDDYQVFVRIRIPPIPRQRSQDFPA